MTETVTQTEAAARLGITRMGVRRALKEGRLTSAPVEQATGFGTRTVPGVAVDERFAAYQRRRRGRQPKASE